jgi:ribosomal 30S subunit maturation factor RimM
VSERICIAQIGGAHGIRGEVKLKSFTADPMAVKDYGTLEREDGGASLEIESVRPAKSHLVARFRGISDRDAAERLTGGTTILLPFNEACVPGVDIAGGRIIVALPATTSGKRGDAAE